uniref:Uncharacterized protein n=1 Tax=Ralstonia solanacearum TaxID=305 RepID=A0A0S4VPT6_RALSL|nr:protein of unknown function [Ralstonia solanacearum]
MGSPLNTLRASYLAWMKAMWSASPTQSSNIYPSKN